MGAQPSTTPTFNTVQHSTQPTAPQPDSQPSTKHVPTLEEIAERQRYALAEATRSYAETQRTIHKEAAKKRRFETINNDIEDIISTEMNLDYYTPTSSYHSTPSRSRSSTPEVDYRGGKRSTSSSSDSSYRPRSSSSDSSYRPSPSPSRSYCLAYTLEGRLCNRKALRGIDFCEKHRSRPTGC